VEHSLELEAIAVGARILILEDNKDNQAALARCIESLGHEAITVSQVAQAIDCISAQNVDLLISGLHLEHDSAFELIKRWKKTEKHNDVPLLFVSTRRNAISNALDGSIKTIVKALGADAVLSTDGIDSAKLCETIDKLLERLTES
jgi:CheY-like chemotaxis protein